MRCNQSNTTDQSLLSLWEKGDETAFEQIYRRYFPQLVTIAYHKTKDRFLAEELAQESLLAFYCKKDYHVSNIPAYLQVILRHKTYDHFRKMLIDKQHAEQAILAKPASIEDTPHQLYHSDLLKSLHRQVLELPLQCRTVFLLSREKHMSNHEIAATLGISVNTVEQHMRKALKRLREGMLMAFLMWVIS